MTVPLACVSSAWRTWLGVAPRTQQEPRASQTLGTWHGCGFRRNVSPCDRRQAGPMLGYGTYLWADAVEKLAVAYPS